MTIEAVITPTEVARARETQITALTFHDMIVQQMDKNPTSIPDAAVDHMISAFAIFHYTRCPIW